MRVPALRTARAVPQFDFRSLEEPRSKKSLLLGKLLALHLFRQDICALRSNQLECYQPCLLAKSQCLLPFRLSSTTHLTAMLASMMSVFTVRDVPREAISRVYLPFCELARSTASLSKEAYTAPPRA